MGAGRPLSFRGVSEQKKGVTLCAYCVSAVNRRNMANKSSEKKMGGDGKYIYGFISTNESDNLGPIGIDQGEVHVFPYQGVAAVVSDLPFTEFNALPKESLLRNLAIYQGVIERVMKEHHVVPVKFGAMIRGEEELKRILENGHRQINRHLKQMEGRIELNVAAVWSDMGTILKEIGEEEGIKRLKEEAASRPPDQVIEVTISVGRLVKETLNKKNEKSAAVILTALKKEAENHCLHGIMDDSMILNAAFLIAKNNQEAFEKKVEELDRHYQNEISFRIVGPLPPYSFSTLEIKKVGFTEVSEAKKMFGLGDEATPGEIRKMYRDLTKKFHPDKFPGDPEAQERFKRITKAYQMLSEYCQEERCFFNKTDVREWISVRPMEQQVTA